MAHTITWLVPGRVINVVISEEASGDNRDSFDSEITAMLDTASQPVHILLDVRAMTSQPSAQSAMGMPYLKHPQMGRLLVIGLKENPFLRFLSALVGRTAGVKIKDFPNSEEAHAYLKTVENVF